ncbi:MAG TPA: MFS transporter [Caulobacteraceae bacterium]
MTDAPSLLAPPARRLGLVTRLFYGFGSVSFGVKDNGFQYLLLIFYNQVVGLPAPAVGLAILVAMLFDAFLDPIVGQVSDNWRSKWGRRHPFMYASALPVAISYLAIWNPPHWSNGHLFFYLVGVAIVIRTFITFYEVPSSALSAELTSGYDERTVLLSYRYFFGWVGGLAINFIAFRFLLTPDKTHPVGQLNPAGYAHYGMVGSVIMFFAILISAAGTHRHIPSLRIPPKRKIRLLAMAKEMVATWSHRSFLNLTLSGVAIAMAAGLGSSMNNYFNTFFWEFSAKQISLFTAGVFISAFLALGGAPIISRRFGKRPSAMVLFILGLVTGITPLILRLMGLMPPNHSPALQITIFFTSIISTAFYIGATTMVSSMIADVVEDSELKTGRRSEGLFFSASSLVAKAVSGMGIFAATVILGLIHFPAAAKPGHVAPEVVSRLAMVYVPTMVFLYAFSLLLMFGYKITRESHAETLRVLAAEAEAVAIAGAPGPHVP